MNNNFYKRQSIFFTIIALAIWNFICSNFTFWGLITSTLMILIGNLLVIILIILEAQRDDNN